MNQPFWTNYRGASNGGKGASGGKIVVAIPRSFRYARNGPDGMHRSGGRTPVPFASPRAIISAPMAPQTPTAYSVADSPHSGFGGNRAIA